MAARRPSIMLGAMLAVMAPGLAADASAAPEKLSARPGLVGTRGVVGVKVPDAHPGFYDAGAALERPRTGCPVANASATVRRKSTLVLRLTAALNGPALCPGRYRGSAQSNPFCSRAMPPCLPPALPLGSFSFRVTRRVLIVAGGGSARMATGNVCGRSGGGGLACTRRRYPFPRLGVTVRPGGRLVVETPNRSDVLRLSLAFERPGKKGTREVPLPVSPDRSRQRWSTTLPRDLDRLYGVYVRDSGTHREHLGRLFVEGGDTG